MWQLYAGRKSLVFLAFLLALYFYPVGARAQQTSAPGTDDFGIPHRQDPSYEDWSKPELTPGMQSETASLGEVKEDGFTRELIHVQWRQLDPIDLWVVRPTGVKKPPVILYLYSYPSTNERYKDAEVCRFLTKDGFAAVGFVSAFTDQRYHDIATKEWFVSMLQAALGSTVHDVQLILNYLDKRGDFDMTRVGMLGDGSGASIAIMAAAVDPRIKVVDLLDPWGDWPNWLAKSTLVPERERASYVKPEFLESVEDLDPVKWLPQLKTQRVRLQYITGDLTVTPAAVREHLEAAAPANAKIVHYENFKIFRTDVASAGKGFDWIKEQLGPTSPVPQKRAQNTAGVKTSDQ
jgi:hypothetical protein